MKKVLILLFTCIAFTSCYTAKFTESTAVIDFRPYSEKGFFITQSDNAPFQYQPIGIVESTIYSGSETREQARAYKREFESSVKSVNKWREATSKDAVEVLVEKCREMGAMGILNLQFSSTVDIKTGNVSAVRASGMAIKK